jgi:hypothetical protein
MEVGRVLVATYDGRDTALSPCGGGLGQVPLGEDPDPQALHLCQADDRRQAGYPASEDEDIEVERF